MDKQHLHFHLCHSWRLQCALKFAPTPSPIWTQWFIMDAEIWQVCNSTLKSLSAHLYVTPSVTRHHVASIHWLTTVSSGGASRDRCSCCFFWSHGAPRRLSEISDWVSHVSFLPLSTFPFPEPVSLLQDWRALHIPERLPDMVLTTPVATTSGNQPGTPEKEWTAMESFCQTQEQDREHTFNCQIFP